MAVSTINDCLLLDIQKISNRSGNISIIDGNKLLPFQPIRIFYLYDIPAGESRGAHAHKTNHQFIIAASGSFEIILDDGKDKRQIALNRPFIGLYIAPGIWAQEINFSSGAICLVLTSDKYNEDDYIRDYADFKSYKEENN